MKKLTTFTKVMYGFGFSARGIKDGLFQLFLFFYFSQVLGLDAALACTAIAAAIGYVCIFILLLKRDTMRFVWRWMRE